MFEIGHTRGTICYLIPGISCTVAGKVKYSSAASGIRKIAGEKVAASQFGSFRQNGHATRTFVHKYMKALSSSSDSIGAEKLQLKALYMISFTYNGID